MEYFWAFTVLIVSLISGNEGYHKCTTNWEVSECSKTCGGGTQTLSGTRMCNLHPCQERLCTDGRDIGIILDKSTSVEEENLETVIDFLKELVQQFNPSPQEDHFGLITFNNKASLEFDFKTREYQGMSALLAKLDSEKGGLEDDTYTDEALKMAEELLFSVAGGDRSDKPNVLLVLTDGEPYWGRDQHGEKLLTSEHFEELANKINEHFKEKNVHVVVIGFGPKAQEPEMDKTLHIIAGPEGEVIKETNFQRLKSHILAIKKAVCSR